MLLMLQYYVPFVHVRVHVDARTGTPPLPTTVVHLRTPRLLAIVGTVFVKTLNNPKENLLICSLQQRA